MIEIEHELQIHSLGENGMNHIYTIASITCETNMDEVKTTIKRIVEMGFLTKNEGLLSLEAYVVQEEDYPEKRFVEKIAEYLSTGIRWKDIDTFLMHRILMMESQKKQYLCLLYKECMKLIGEDSFIYFAKDCICSLVPEKYENEISEYINQIFDSEYNKWNEKKNIRIAEEYAKIDILFPLELKEEMKMFEEMAKLRSDNRYTQTWLRLMNYGDVYHLMLIGSENFKEAILSNMSSRMKQTAKEEVVDIAKNWNEDSVNVIRKSISKGIEVLNQI